jgi:hypothetical protein
MNWLNILVAYPYYKGLDLTTLPDRTRLVIDSGAFTAWKSGKPIALDDYCRFIEGLKTKPWRYFSLDVIGDPHASMQNYETMLRRGFSPMPVFTRGEDFSVLEDYYKTSEVVGVGGLVGTPKNKQFVNKVMRHVNGRKCHWLGFTNRAFVMAYKPYMCDSSSHDSQAAMYGTLSVYLGRGRSVQLSCKDFAHPPQDVVIEALRKEGACWSQLAKKEMWSGGKSVSRYLGAAFGLKESIELERIYSVKKFLACCVQQNIVNLVKVYERNYA